jgi:hypothetical protein
MNLASSRARLSAEVAERLPGDEALVAIFPAFSGPGGSSAAIAGTLLGAIGALFTGTRRSWCVVAVTTRRVLLFESPNGETIGAFRTEFSTSDIHVDVRGFEPTVRIAGATLKVPLPWKGDLMRVPE